MSLLDILQKFPQYEQFPYAEGLNCPECDKSGFYNQPWENRSKPKLIGWTETHIGPMAVFECPDCGCKYRFHTTIGRWNADLDEFEDYLYFHAKRCSNWEEIKKQLKDE